MRSTKGITSALAATVMAAAVLAGCTGGGGGTGGVPAQYSSTGPATVATASEGQTTFYYPSNLASGSPRPVILWGNGTGASPSSYNALLRHYASHGFIVAAANTPNAGSGREMLAGLDLLQRGNTQAGSRWNGRVDLANVGTTGHSQGGGGAIAAARDARVKTTFPLEGWRGEPAGLRGSAIFFSGENDTIVSPSSVRQDYTQSTGIPAAYAELAGASHFTAMGSAGGFRGASTAWARWQLAGDTAARSQFVGTACGLCNNSSWSEYEANARLQAL